MLEEDWSKSFLVGNIEKDDVGYMFRGEFTYPIIAGVMDLMDEVLKSSIDTYNIKSKIYFIMGESLQNITRHHSQPTEDEKEVKSMFSLQRQGQVYVITTGNLISNKEIASLKEKIDKINMMERIELRNYSRSTRSTSEFYEKKGAGLGLIEMAKRSGSKLEYDFQKIDETNSYLYLNTEVPLEYKDIPKTPVDYKYSIDSIQELHEIIIKENIILFFKGAFNQSSLLSLLTMVESQMKSKALSLKIYNTMVEMLQNISKHADNFVNEVDWKPGVFFISEEKENHKLFAGNYIKNSKIEAFRRKIDYANSLSERELIIEYHSILQNFDIQTYDKGLGLLDLIKKSKSKLEYNFYKIDDLFSFFMIQVVINKKGTMDSLIIEQTKETPYIHFAPRSGIFEITNRSLPEDADEFYLPVMSWLNRYIIKPNESTKFIFKLDYYNTTSARYISKIIDMLNDLSKTHDVKIYWHYDSNDEDMEYNGERFKELNDVEIELVEY